MPKGDPVTQIYTILMFIIRETFKVPLGAPPFLLRLRGLSGYLGITLKMALHKEPNEPTPKPG